MQHPEKRNEIVSRMRERIRLAEYPPGFRLPVEPELASEFGVARETLRGALRILEEDGLLERIPRKGTFITSEKENRNGAEKRQIYLLVPCPDYFIKSNYSTRENISYLLSGCLSAAHKMNCEVVTLPVSQDNTQEHIDWRALDRLNSESRVIFHENWFFPLYPLLRERRCKVVQIHGMNEDACSGKNEMRTWYRINLNSWADFRRSVISLHHCGCRRIAIAGCYFDDPLNPTLHGYRKGLNAVGQTEELILRNSRNNISYPEYLHEIRPFYQKTGFDGLITHIPDMAQIDYRKSLNCNLGIPESVHILTERHYEFNDHLFPKIPYQESEYQKAGEMAVGLLLQQNYTPYEIHLNKGKEDE